MTLLLFCPIAAPIKHRLCTCTVLVAETNLPVVYVRHELSTNVDYIIVYVYDNKKFTYHHGQNSH